MLDASSRKLEYSSMVVFLGAGSRKWEKHAASGKKRYTFIAQRPHSPLPHVLERICFKVIESFNREH